ncbi:MAG: flavin reductase [Bacteroidales bacterium]|nr:flavin reductase [Bacteroidales bacterium]
MQDFSAIKPTEITDNVFKLLDKDWMLITAGTPEDYNTMTASWGHMGIMWNLPVAIGWIRPQRYTFEFAEKYSYFTLSFFTEEYRKALQFCGSRSGRDHDKAAETGLTPVATESGNVFFREARLVMECRKLYVDDLKAENFLVPEIARKHYAAGDFHRFYMGEITGVLRR